MRASSFLELPQTSMVKKLQKKSQMPMKIVPMDSECPKTPSWDFSAPHLAKNSKS
jgi:hypothetical protein